MQSFTLYSWVRPFGISTIVGAVDKDGPALYVVEPSGSSFVRMKIPDEELSFTCSYRATIVRPLARVVSWLKQNWKSSSYQKSRFVKRLLRLLECKF